MLWAGESKLGAARSLRSRWAPHGAGQRSGDSPQRRSVYASLRLAPTPRRSRSVPALRCLPCVVHGGMRPGEPVVVVRSTACPSSGSAPTGRSCRRIQLPPRSTRAEAPARSANRTTPHVGPGMSYSSLPFGRRFRFVHATVEPVSKS